jgi:hypothetical protein
MPRCNLCNDFQRSPRQFRLAFDFKYAEIVRSAQRGCLVCSLLLEGMRCFEPSLGDFGDIIAYMSGAAMLMAMDP